MWDRECSREIALVVPCGIENALERLLQLYHVGYRMFWRDCFSCTMWNRECSREIDSVLPCVIDNVLERLLQLYYVGWRMF